MQNNMDKFFHHDPDGFQAYLISVEQGKKTISGATLLPHELVAQAVALQSESESGLDRNGNANKYPALVQFRKDLAKTQQRVIEAQWKTLIESLRDSGRIENALAVCDVSGSMGSLYCGHQIGRRRRRRDVQPVVPAIALSLVLASLAKPPFNGGFITFSSRPEYIPLDLTKPLHETVLGMSQAGWADGNGPERGVYPAAFTAGSEAQGAEGGYDQAFVRVHGHAVRLGLRLLLGGRRIMML